MGWLANATTWPLYPWEKDRIPIVQEPGWAQILVYTSRKILLPPGFDTQTVHPVASRYTD